MYELSLYDANRVYLDIVLLTILVTSIYYEIKENRIPNFLTLGGIVFGLVVLFLIADGPQLQSHLMGLVLGFGLFYIFYLFSWVSGGDVKLIGAIGILKGVAFVIHVLVYTAIFGGLLAIGYAIFALWKKQSIWKQRIPYGTAIVMGAFYVLAHQYKILT